VQFVVDILHTLYNLLFEPDCPYPKWADCITLGYGIILIILFSNFYRQSYR
jgi:hypothetical protein